ncbi:MAG: ATP-binding cassette domain-containing protein [Pseudonocardiaceae bacterium]
MTMTEHGAVRLTDLRKRYGSVQAVDGVDLLVAPGEVVALLGPNGAGKSTTVDLLLGLTCPDGGKARIFGRSPREAVAAGEVGAMLQDGALLEDATVGETVGLVAALHRRPLPVAEALRRAGVATPLQQAVRGAAAAGPLRRRDRQRPRSAGARRAHGGHGRGDPPVVLALDAALLRRRAHRAVRHALPGGGAGVRRPGGAHAVGTDHRGRLGGRGPGHGGRCAPSSQGRTTARWLAAHPTARDIEITAVGLEEAFLALTADMEEV